MNRLFSKLQLAVNLYAKTRSKCSCMSHIHSAFSLIFASTLTRYFVFRKQSITFHALIFSSVFLLLGCVPQEKLTPTPTPPPASVPITEQAPIPIPKQTTAIPTTQTPTSVELPAPAQLVNNPITVPRTLAALTHSLEVTLAKSTVQINKTSTQVTLVLPSYYAFVNPRRINTLFKPDLHDIITILKIYQPNRIQIVGYTDNEAGFFKNMATSKSWANTIMQYLVKHGIPKENMTVSAHGSMHPCATNFTAAGRFKNRRVEIVISM